VRKSKVHYAWVIVLAGTLVVFLSHGLGRMAYSVILPPMRAGLGLSYTEAGLIGTANFFGYLSFTVLSGLFAFKIGARRTIFSSLLVMGATLFLTGLSRSFRTAFLLRFATGVANGGAYIPTMALPASWFRKEKRGLASGLLTVGTGLGLFFTGTVLPPFMDRFGEQGWRYAWFLIGGSILLLSVPCFVLLRDRPSELGLSPYGKGGEEASSSVSLKGLLIKKELWQLGIIYFMYGLSYIVYITFYVSFLSEELKVPFVLAGRIFGLLGLFSIGSGVFWGWLSDLLGRARAFALAYISLALSCLMPLLFPNAFAYYASSIVFGLTLSSIPAMMAAASSDASSGTLAAFALGVATIFFGVGQTIGPGLAGYLKDVTGSFRGIFILSSLLSLVGAKVSLRLGG
jgi:MFS family permease